MKTEIQIEKLWFADDRIYILTSDGITLWQSLLWYRRLRHATDEQRLNYRISCSGIHWREVDEDVSFESFLHTDREPSAISRLFLTHPELNISAIARQTGIEHSLLTSCITGATTLTPAHEAMIKKAVRKTGKELTEI
jgi:hypothetical protein